MTTRRLGGKRFVILLYLSLVAVTGVAGLLTGAFVEDLTAPRLFFLLSLPATPLGFAVYGAVTVGVALGVPLVLVSYVSRNVDDVEA